jgi:glycosyltransferase involved in cell wall biosynthesis
MCNTFMAMTCDLAAPTNLRTSPVPEPRHPEADVWEVRLNREPLNGDWPPDASVPLSVLVPVRNEQANLAECLHRLTWAAEVIVVDSQSTDGTIPIAQVLGAQVYQFYYSAEGWPKKKNWALSNIPWRHDWVLIMDADEHMTPELAREISVAIDRPDSPDGYWLNRRFMFMGRWLRHCGYYPSWNLRLFRHAMGCYERIGMLGQTSSGDNEVHEHVVLSNGRAAGYLTHDFLHYAYPDLSTWVEKHNRYSSWEAHAMLAGDCGQVASSLFGGPVARRRWLKARTRNWPFRPVLRFLYAYLWQGGFRDGYPGYCLCRLLAWYEFISLAKAREMRSTASPKVTKHLGS